MRPSFVSGISQAEVAALATKLKADINAAAGGPSMKLFDNNFTPGPFAVLADFHEATFTGYAAYPLGTYQAQLFADPLAWRVYLPGVGGFQTAGGFTPATIYGWYVVDATTGLSLYHWGRFDKPLELVVVGQTIIIQPEVQFPLTTGRSRV